MTTSTAQYTLRLGQAFIETIDHCIELEQRQQQLDPQSNPWLAIQDELAERLQEIGDMVIWEYRQAPF